MRTSTGKPTAADLRRFRAMQEAGCVCCFILGVWSPPEIHHILSGGRRMGHQFSLPLCALHHRGVAPKGYRDAFGPSLSDGSKPFAAFWGTEMSLLEKVNKMISSGKRL